MQKTVETIGRYELAAELGRGSMGVVHRAHDPVMGRDVAIKTILMPHGLDRKRTDEYHERFLREARAAGRLSHPGIVTIYDFDRHTDGLPFIAMEFVEGPTLHELICHEGALKPAWAIEVATTLADALETAHALDIVHRDLKPANVLVRAADGATKITDFGVARMSRSDLTQVGVTYGSPAYIAPECLRGQRADGRSDLFALGVILYEMLSGGRPFDGTDFAAVCHAICNEAPRPIGVLAADLTPAFNTFFARALAKDPERRFQTGAEFSRALSDVRRQQELYDASGGGDRIDLPAAATMRIDADDPDVADLRPAPMGRTGELVTTGPDGPGQSDPPEMDAGATRVLAFPVPAATQEPAPLNIAGATRAVVDRATDTSPVERTPDPSSDEIDRVDRMIVGAVALLKRQPALAGGFALGVLLLLLVGFAGRKGTTQTPPPATDAADATAAANAGDLPLFDEPPLTIPDVSIDASPVGFELEPAPVVDGADPLADDVEPASSTPRREARRAPVERRPAPQQATRTPVRSEASPPRAVVTETKPTTPATRPAAPVAEVAPPIAQPAATATKTSVAPAGPVATIPMVIEIRSALKDATIEVALDGTTIYSESLTAESSGFRRALNKAIRRDEHETDHIVAVSPGVHRFFVSVTNNAKDATYTTELEATLAADGPRTLRIATGRLLGKRLSVELVD